MNIKQSKSVSIETNEMQFLNFILIQQSINNNKICKLIIVMLSPNHSIFKGVHNLGKKDCFELIRN
ncbi:hypothetical protein BpHYR1_032691 [Brachionus plicatilis]|uniref:Uncharacterized protein n=1 Tax=Brachionus plicatilis TaxID=10195 RepID=A0A3M7Q3Z8_BRAPC|nr:hypothetical protein BpHYR1_032691 [Brachionus plicatilis]